jgi:hypothetical protein
MLYRIGGTQSDDLMAIAGQMNLHTWDFREKTQKGLGVGVLKYSRDLLPLEFGAGDFDALLVIPVEFFGDFA